MTVSAPAPGRLTDVGGLSIERVAAAGIGPSRERFGEAVALLNPDLAGVTVA